MQARIRDVEAGFGGRGRVLVRYSGTEPLLRIMAEGRDPAEVDAAIAALAEIAAKSV